jgi:O-antigen/teichoic acid export membrane protein
LRACINALGMGSLGRRQLGYRLRPGLRGRNLGRLLRIALLQWAAQVLPLLAFHLDVLLIRVQRGEVELGIFSAAFRLVLPMVTLPALFLGPLVPALSAATLGDRELLMKYLRGAASILCGLGTLCGVAGVLLAPDLLEVLYPGRYADAAPSLRWLWAAFAFVCSALPFTTVLLVQGRERTLLRLTTLAFLANAIATLLLLPHHGISAAPAATAVAQAFLCAGAGAAVLGPRDLMPTLRAIARASLPALGLAAVLPQLAAAGLIPRLAVALLFVLAGLWWNVQAPAAVQMRLALQRERSGGRPPSE